MPTRLYKLKQHLTHQHLEWAQRLSAHLQQLGFTGKEFDDLLYGIAQVVSLQLKAELSEKMATKLAENEYTAAEEINQHSLVDQLLVLRNWHLDDNELKILIMKSLGIELDEKFWFNFKKR